MQIHNPEVLALILHVSESHFICFLLSIMNINKVKYLYMAQYAVMAFCKLLLSVSCAWKNQKEHGHQVETEVKWLMGKNVIRLRITLPLPFI